MSLCLVLPHIITICDGKTDGSFTLHKDFPYAVFPSQSLHAHAHSDIVLNYVSWSTGYRATVNASLKETQNPVD